MFTMSRRGLRVNETKGEGVGGRVGMGKLVTSRLLAWTLLWLIGLASRLLN